VATEAPLAGARVLITRAADDAAPLRDRLEALGAHVLEPPAIEIAPPEDFAPLDEALRALDRFDWIVFTSRRAVRAVLDRLDALDLSIDPRPRVAAVGPSTEGLLAEQGIRVDCRPEEATASALAAALERWGVAGQRILFPTGDLAGPELRERLETAGAEVHQVVVYRTVVPAAHSRGRAPREAPLRDTPVRGRGALPAVRCGEVDIIALASPSAARNLAAMLGTDAPLLRKIRLVCIGPSTAAAVRHLGFRPAAVAAEHTLDGLVAAIVAAHNGEII
jgi:uroporphyrinogen III methyltransferase/synthase